MTIKARLLSLREEVGGYITYVFENLDSLNLYDKYIMCKRFPNWETPFINIGVKGFLNFKEVIAGKDTWYDHESGSDIAYKYTDIHFINFVEDKKSQPDIIL